MTLRIFGKLVHSHSSVYPEVGGSGGTSDPWAAGIDTGVYPTPRTYLVGVNIKF